MSRHQSLGACSWSAFDDNLVAGIESNVLLYDHLSGECTVAEEHLHHVHALR